MYQLNVSKIKSNKISSTEDIKTISIQNTKRTKFSKLKYLLTADDVYGSLLPLYFFTKVCALSPFGIQQKNSLFQYTPSKIGAVYSFITLFSFVGYYIVATGERDSLQHKETSTVDQSIDFFHLYSNVIVMSISIILNYTNQYKMIKTIEKLHIIDGKILELGEKINHTKVKIYNMFYMIISTTLIGILEYSNCSMFIQELNTFSTFCLLMCYIPLLINAFVQSQFVLYVLILKYRFLLINNAIEKLILKHNNKTSNINNDILHCNYSIKKRISLINYIHRDLCLISEQINQLFSVQILGAFIVSFVASTTHAYSSATVLISLYSTKPKKLYDLFTSLVWGVYYGIEMFVISIACYCTMQEAKRSGILIHKITVKFTENIKKEVKYFSQQILHTTFNFTVCGLFDLDLQLIHSIVASISTYLIILTQLAEEK